MGQMMWSSKTDHACVSTQRGIVSGSADHDVKFWDFELVTDEEYSATR